MLLRILDGTGTCWNGPEKLDMLGFTEPTDVGMLKLFRLWAVLLWFQGKNNAAGGGKFLPMHRWNCTSSSTCCQSIHIPPYLKAIRTSCKSPCCEGSVIYWLLSYYWNDVGHCMNIPTDPHEKSTSPLDGWESPLQWWLVINKALHHYCRPNGG